MNILKKILSTVITVCIVAMALLFVAPKLFGIEPKVVLSGSMEPTYPVGSLIFVEKVTPSELKVDDNVTFYMQQNTVVTHRIIEINDDQTFTTKGDNNNSADGEKLTYGQVIGKASEFAIPFLGYIAVFLQSPIGYAIIAALIVMMIASSLLDKKRERKES